jgi:hypothetical protein
MNRSARIMAERRARKYESPSISTAKRWASSRRQQVSPSRRIGGCPATRALPGRWFCGFPAKDAPTGSAMPGDRREHAVSAASGSTPVRRRLVSCPAGGAFRGGSVRETTSCATRCPVRPGICIARPRHETIQSSGREERLGFERAEPTPRRGVIAGGSLAGKVNSIARSRGSSAAGGVSAQDAGS